jgi:hypothetical protein
MSNYPRLQPAGETVRIDGWKCDENFPFHPIGSQPKRVVICPDDAKDYLRPGRKYIFKTAKRNWQQQQLWAEVLAYRIGSLLGIDVPPCFIGLDGNTGEAGALVEFFLDVPGEAIPPRLVHASDYMTRILADKKRGRPHALRANLRLCNALRLSDPTQWWAAVLVFDALIGNTDRHPDNWGFLIRHRPGERASFAFAPAFDNATSLGYEQPDDKLPNLTKPKGLATYIARGTHHCAWDLADDRPEGHVGLCKRLIVAHPEAGEAARNVIRFDASKVEYLVRQCTQFDVPIVFSADRAEFVLALIEARKAGLATAFGVE